MGVKMTLINIIKIYWNTSFNHYCHQRRTAWDRDMNSKEKTERDRIKEKSRYIKNIERGNNIFICMCVTWEVVSFLPPLAAVKHNAQRVKMICLTISYLLCRTIVAQDGFPPSVKRQILLLSCRMPTRLTASLQKTATMCHLCRMQRHVR